MKLTTDEAKRIKAVLDDLLSKSNALREHARDKDPVGLIYKYANKEDQEAAAFIASTLSYGKQDTFRPIIARILNQMGDSPVDFITDVLVEDLEDKFSWFQYRFNKPVDIACLILALRGVYETGFTLENLFKSGYEDNNSFQEGCSYLTKALKKDWYVHAYAGIHEHELKGFQYLIPSPQAGSACKRLCMFLRWMIRQDDIDVGNWTDIPTKDLIIPLDTHVARISKDLGLTNKSGGTWKVAEDITDSLRQLNPDDPLVYDFPICTAGIQGQL
jgi:uncharacterized protein (TIGR02757 family)